MSGSSARRLVSLILWAAVLMAPSIAVAGGLLAGGTAVMLAPTLWRLGARHREARRADPRLGGSPESGPSPDGEVLLGRDPARRSVTLTDRQLSAHALIVGASGAGKSTTMLGILGAQIARGHPVIAIDMKGSAAFAAELERAAAASGRRLRTWTPDGPGHWNPLAHGNATSLKDKLISTERFTEPHYQRAAERYVQIALHVLHASRPDRPAELHEVVEVMEPRRLAARLRHVPTPLAERVQDYLTDLTSDQLSAVRGLGTRLALLSESTAGPYLRTGGGPAGASVDLRAGVEGGDVILLSINSSVYGSLAAQLGALAIQDLVSAAGQRLTPDAAHRGTPPATVAIDEFSALGADNVLALLARGREAGISVLVATQEMSDLERAGRGFRDQVLGIVGIKIAHRQDVPASAEMIAQMAGTERVWEQTENIRGMFAGAGASRGTRRLVERYTVHPNEIKTLPTGAAVVLTKLPAARVERVWVAPPPARAAASTPARTSGRAMPSRRGRAIGRPSTDARASPRGREASIRGNPRSPGRDGDQPAPGVTR